MRTRIAVAVVSIVIYIALVEIGVRMLWVRDDAVHEAARAGIAIDTYWWTPLSLGVADGLSLPAVIIGHIPLLLANRESTDRPSMVGELSIAPLVGLFWFWLVGAGERLCRRIRADPAVAKIASQAAFGLSALLLGLLMWWGFTHHYGDSVPFSSLSNLRLTVEMANTLERLFGVAWVALGALCWVIDSASRKRNRQVV
jgi:hypothetical protein